MISPVSTTRNDAIGGKAFTDNAWKKLMERVDSNIEAVKE